MSLCEPDWRRCRKGKAADQIPSSAENDDFPDGDADLDLPVETDIPRLDPLATAAFWHSIAPNTQSRGVLLWADMFRQV